MTMIDDDYTEGDRYDWDQSDDSQYCEHGTFIGSWWGPDILCSYCEMGVSKAEYRRIQRQQRLRPMRVAEQHYNAMLEYLTTDEKARRIWGPGGRSFLVTLVLIETMYVSDAVVAEYFDG